MKITKSVEVEVEFGIPWEYGKYGHNTYMKVCGDRVITVSNNSIFLNSSVIDFIVNDAIACSEEEFNEALDALISKLSTLREGGEL